MGVAAGGGGTPPRPHPSSLGDWIPTLSITETEECVA